MNCNGLDLGCGLPKVIFGRNGKPGRVKPCPEGVGKLMRILGKNGKLGSSIPGGSGFVGPGKLIRIVGRKGMLGSCTPGVPGCGAENGSPEILISGSNGLGSFMDLSSGLGSPGRSIHTFGKNGRPGRGRPGGCGTGAKFGKFNVTFGKKGTLTIGSDGGPGRLASGKTSDSRSGIIGM